MPELRGRSGRIARALLPGPYTLVLPNPARRFRWLTGSTPDTHRRARAGARRARRAEVLEQVGAVVATSANLPAGLTRASVDDVPVEIRAGAAAIVDGGELPGTASTVLDLTGHEPQVLREGAVPAAEALERALAAGASSIRG